MNHIVIDNFLSDPKTERELALSAEYHDIEHRGLNYRGISPVEDPSSFERIEKAVGMKLPKRECIYRRYLPEYKNETHIHNDCLIATFTGICFLTPPEHCKGGLAFWKHRALGWEAQPMPEAHLRFGFKDDDYYLQVHKDGFDEDRWKMVDYVPMQFNRMVIFWGPRYHSRYPKDPPGTGMKDCRLIKVFFGMVGDESPAV